MQLFTQRRRFAKFSNSRGRGCRIKVAICLEILRLTYGFCEDERTSLPLDKKSQHGESGVGALISLIALGRLPFFGSIPHPG